jgi:hypothetical protein
MDFIILLILLFVNKLQRKEKQKGVSKGCSSPKDEPLGK